MTSKWLKFAAVPALAGGMLFAQTQTPAPAPDSGQQHARAGHRRENPLARMAQFLNLTDAQKEQAKAVFQDAKQQAQPLEQQMRQQRQALHQAIQANDVNQIQQLSAQQGVLMGKLAAIRNTAFARVYSNLTPEQRTKADQMRDQMKTRFQHRPGRSNG